MSVKKASDSANFVVACRGRASAIFRPHEALSLTYKDQAGWSRRMQFGTRYRNLGYSAAVPEDLWVHTEGPAPTIETAIRTAAVGSQDILVVIGLASNAWMGRIEPEVAFDSTKGKTAREFWQAFVPEAPIAVVPGRFVELPATKALLQVFQTSPYRDGLHRAAAQYYAALERWTLGAEIFVVAHLFMAAEALKIVALRHALAETKLGEDDLATRWDYKPKPENRVKPFLESEARRRIVFQGDAACLSTAKKISDSFEHGFAYEGANLADDAALVAENVAAYVRKCLIKLAGVADAEQTILVSPPYDRPLGPLQLLNIFRATLRGLGEGYARPGDAYPIMKWKHRLAAVEVDSQGKYGFRPEEKLTAHIGKGFTMGAIRYEVWGRGRYQTADGTPGELKAEITDDRKTGAKILGMPARLIEWILRLLRIRSRA